MKKANAYEVDWVTSFLVQPVQNWLINIIDGKQTCPKTKAANFKIE